MSDAAAPEPAPLRIERIFGAPIDDVFDAWTSAAVLRRWWPAGRGWETTAAEVDVRVGGALRLVMRTPDGAEYGGVGRYVEVSRPERLVFTWRWDAPAVGPTQLIEVSLTSNPDATTTVVLVNRGLTAAELEDHRSGWQISFDNLDAVLAERSNRAGTDRRETRCRAG